MIKLPQIDVPTYKHEFSSAEIRFRGFTIAEEKILLEVSDSTDKEKIDAMQQVLTNCTFDKIDVGALSKADFSLLFIKIVSKSLGEVNTLKYKCTTVFHTTYFLSM